MFIFKCCNESPALLLSLTPNCRAGYNSQFDGLVWVVSRTTADIFKILWGMGSNLMFVRIHLIYHPNCVCVFVWHDPHDLNKTK